MKWNETIDTYLKNYRLVQHVMEPCLYTKKTSNSQLIVLLYVDDILFLATDDSTLTAFETYIKTRFKIKTTTSVNSFIGFNLQPVKGGVLMDASHYIVAQAKRFRQFDAKEEKLPGTKTFLNISSEILEDKKLFQSILGVFDLQLSSIV